MKNKNHSLQTRRVAADHYQVVMVNVQSGKCIKKLADAVREPDMSQSEFERYIEGLFQGFTKIERDGDIVAGILRNEFF